MERAPAGGSLRTELLRRKTFFRRQEQLMDPRGRRLPWWNPQIGLDLTILAERNHSTFSETANNNGDKSSLRRKRKR